MIINFVIGLLGVEGEAHKRQVSICIAGDFPWSEATMTATSYDDYQHHSQFETAAEDNLGI